jgi:integrase
MTIGAACIRFFDEVGQFHRDPKATAWSLKWIVDFLGAAKPIADIDDDDVARMVAKRRGEPVNNVARENGRRKKGPAKLVSAARVNRSVTEPLRKVLRRAALWKQQTQAATIRWKEHLLPEPKERTADISFDAEAAILANLNPAHHAAVTFALRTGLRETPTCLLEWDQIDWENIGITFVNKGGDTEFMPISPAVRDLLWLLWSQKKRHPVRVFTNSDGDPLTVSAYVSALKRAAKKAGIRFRPHDLRHTAATRLLRTTRNLKLVQKALTHSDIQTTMKYAHVLDEDLRQGLAMQDAVEANKNTLNQADRESESGLKVVGSKPGEAK